MVSGFVQGHAGGKCRAGPGARSVWLQRLHASSLSASFLQRMCVGRPVQGPGDGVEGNSPGSFRFSWGGENSTHKTTVLVVAEGAGGQGRDGVGLWDWQMKAFI